MMRIETHSAWLQPLRLDEFVEKLRGSLVQVAKIATLVLIKLHIGMTDEYLANKHPRLGVGHLPSFVGCFDQSLCTIHIDSSSPAAEWAKKPTVQQRSEFPA